MRKRKTLLTTVVLVLISAVAVTTATAATKYKNWTKYETSYVNDTVRSDHASTRKTKDKRFEVYVKDKSMWSTPQAKIVNSQGASRSSWVKLSLEGKNYKGTNNLCEKNYKYYLKIKAAWNQIGTDSIKYKFSVH